MIGEVGSADELRERCPAGRLDDDVDVVVRTATFGANGPSRLASPGRVARPGHLVAEVLVRIFVQWAMSQALLIAQLHPTQVEHGRLHRNLNTLPTAGVGALEQRSQDRRNEVNPGARVADLCACGSGGTGLGTRRGQG